jgi:periplasmic protein TonB
MSFPSWLTFKPSVVALLIVTFATPLMVLAEGPAFDVRPVPTKTPPPEYPHSLKRDGVSGVVAVKVLIDATGSVAECSVSKSTNPGFEEAALEAVKKWKFKPAKKDGAPVEARLIIPIHFQIND